MSVYVFSPFLDNLPSPLWIAMGPATAGAVDGLLTTARAENTVVAEIVVDLRDSGLDRDWNLDELVRIREPFFAWLRGSEERPASNTRVVLLCPGRGAIDHLVAWASRPENCDCPSFWFASGFELLDVPTPEQEGGDEATVTRLVSDALARLKLHPFVAMAHRADEIVGDIAFHFTERLGTPSFKRPNFADRSLGRPAEVKLILPGHYELEDGTLAMIPGQLPRAVLRHLLVELTGADPMRPSARTGCALLPASGWWWAGSAGREAEENAELALFFARVDRGDVASLMSYLRFAWLQDDVFATWQDSAIRHV